MFVFIDRQDAGRQLADGLVKYHGKRTVILGLTRGGVAIAYEVALILDVPMDVLIVRKIGAPFNQELGVGAIAEDGTLYLDQPAINALGISNDDLQTVIDGEKQLVADQIDLLRDGESLPALAGKTVILVDDGLATGATAEAAIAVVRKKRARKVIFAAPVCASETAEKLEKKVDGLVCLQRLSDLQAISLYYKNFRPVTNDQVVDMLDKTKRE